MQSNRVLVLTLAVAAGLMMVTQARADSFSFTGTFSQDDNVQLFNFSVGATSNVLLQTWSYAGGMDAAGAQIPEGGFDPMLALFDGNGNFITGNDDGGCVLVPRDPVTTNCWDSYINRTDLAPGSYTVALTEYQNLPNDNDLADGFEQDGQGNFTTKFANSNTPAGCTQFIDFDGNCRTGNWELDIEGVKAASMQPASPVPEPPVVWLLGTGMLVLLGAGQLRQRVTGRAA